jgi:transcriptional regulator with XRE-family HTH domain
MARLGERVRYERAKWGYTQQQLADLTGIDRDKIAKIERNMRDIQAAEIAPLASALRLDIDALLAAPDHVRMRVNPDRPATQKAIEWFERCISNSLFVSGIGRDDGR